MQTIISLVGLIGADLAFPAAQSSAVFEDTDDIFFGIITGKRMKI